MNVVLFQNLLFCSEKGNKFMAYDKNAQAKYNKEHTVMISFKLNKKTDADLIHWLEIQGNRQAYLKAVIKSDLERFEEENFCKLMTMTNKTMAESANDPESSKAWYVELSVSTSAKSKSGIIAAVRKATSMFDDLDDDELAQTLKSEFCEYCKDGINFWVNGY